MGEEIQTVRPVLSTYEDIDAALRWLEQYAQTKTELSSLMVQYYAVDLDMLATRLTH